jgi:hypothetical protein
MGTAARPASHYGFAFGKDFLDRKTDVGESIAVEGYSLFLTLGATAEIGRGTVVVNVSGREELVCYRHLALVPNFFEQTAYVIFVLFKHGESPFLKTHELATGI